jgi:hypothetical protein
MSNHETTGWQPIETAPRDGAEILAADGAEHYICRWADCADACSQIPKHGWATQYNDHWMTYDEESPTHWMPLPPLPTAP